MIDRFNGFALWARIVVIICVAILGYVLVTSAVGGIKSMLFGNPEVKRERANTVVAQEQGQAEADIADGTIGAVQEREVYREHVREIVRESQERVNAADRGQQMDPEIDAAVATGLCGVHDSLCRRAGAAPVQPLRGPVPGAD
jgi:hypothetical protein